VINASSIFRWIVIGFLAIALIQEDLVSSDRSEWVTRPIGPFTLLAAKLLFVAGALAAPAGLIGAASARHYGLSLTTSIAIGTDDGARAALAAAAFAAVGAMTSSLLSAGMALVGAAVAKVLVQPYLDWLAHGERSGWPDLLDHRRAVAVVFGVVVIVLAYQFRRRNWRRAVLLTVFLGPASLVVASRRPAVPNPPAVGVTLEAIDPNGFFGGFQPRPFPLGDEAIVGIQVRASFPKDADYYLENPQSQFVGRSGLEYSMSSRGVSYLANESVFDTLEWATPWGYYPRLAEAVGAVLPSHDESARNQAALEMPSRVLDRFRGSTGALSASSRVMRVDIGMHGSLPFQAGASVRLPGLFARVESIRFTNGDSVEISVRTITVNSSRSPNGYLVWALINNDGKGVSLEELAPLGNRILESPAFRDSTRGIGFRHRWHRGVAGPELGIAPAWAKDAQIAFFGIRFQPCGDATLLVPNFTLPKLEDGR